MTSAQGPNDPKQPAPPASNAGSGNGDKGGLPPNLPNP